MQTVSLTAAAVVLGRDRPELRTPVQLAWWVSLLLVPPLLIFGLPFGEARPFYDFTTTRTGEAVAIYSCLAVSGAAALVLRYAVVHAASALTAAVVDDLALALAYFIVVCVASPDGPQAYNLLGLLLVLPMAVAVHVWYMLKWRETRAMAMSGGAAPAAEDAEAGGKGGKGGGEKGSPSETSSLVGGAGAGGGGGCTIA